MTLEHIVEAADGLTRDVWDFELRADNEAIVLRLNRTLRGVRPSRRHKWTTSRTWERSREGAAPKIPDAVREAVTLTLIGELRAAVDAAR